MTRFYMILFVTLFLIAGCEKDGNRDRTETVFLTVSHEYAKYILWGESSLREGINIKEDNASYWQTLPINGIEGFNYEVGFEYRLKVLKTHLTNPPADGLDVSYKLLQIISKTEMSD
ncbi:MAG: DUF4377 domain-containing protein [Tannerella sp.]|nr:DUF4377 domain-containing protein [Tannerella sp.]